MAVAAGQVRATWLWLQSGCGLHGCRCKMCVGYIAVDARLVWATWLWLQGVCGLQGCGSTVSAGYMAVAAGQVWVTWLWLQGGCGLHGCGFRVSAGCISKLLLQRITYFTKSRLVLQLKKNPKILNNQHRCWKCHSYSFNPSIRGILYLVHLVGI